MNYKDRPSKMVVRTTKSVKIEVCPHCDAELGNMDTTNFIKLDKDYKEVDKWTICNNCKGKIYY